MRIIAVNLTYFQLRKVEFGCVPNILEYMEITCMIHDVLVS